MRCNSRLRSLERKTNIGKNKWVIIYIPDLKDEKQEGLVYEKTKKDFLERNPEARDCQTFIQMKWYCDDIPEPQLQVFK